MNHRGMTATTLDLDPAAGRVEFGRAVVVRHTGGTR
jgi:hypothetical protein